MGKHKQAFVAFDSAKEKHAVAIAADGRDGEVRYLDEIDDSPHAVRKLVTTLSHQYERLRFCYEAGPTGYGLHQQLTDLCHVCDVAAPTTRTMERRTFLGGLVAAAYINTVHAEEWRLVTEDELKRELPPLLFSSPAELICSETQPSNMILYPTFRSS